MGLGLRVQGLECRVWGLGLGVQVLFLECPARYGDSSLGLMVASLGAKTVSASRGSYEFDSYSLLGGPFDLVSRVSKVGYGGL